MCRRAGTGEPPLARAGCARRATGFSIVGIARPAARLRARLGLVRRVQAPAVELHHEEISMIEINVDECHDVSGGFVRICGPAFPGPTFPGPTFPGPILPIPGPMPLAITAHMPICALID
jgi:hypothetical protein